MWLALIVSNVYSLGLGCALMGIGLAVYKRPAEWAWVPEGLLTNKRTVYRRALIMAILWPLSIPAMYIVSREMGMPDNPLLRRLACVCFLLAIAAGVSTIQVTQ